jgi:polyhydroxyalkanoate synthesis regulator phasin
MLDELRRIALFGSGVAELTRHQAEQVVKDLVKQGEVRRQQASSVARDLVERSRQNRVELLRVIRTEIRNQIESLGVASKRDFERLERRIARLEGDRKKTSAKKPTSGAKSTAKKTASKSTGTRSGPS